MLKKGRLSRWKRRFKNDNSYRTFPLNTPIKSYVSLVYLFNCLTVPLVRDTYDSAQILLWFGGKCERLEPELPIDTTNRYLTAVKKTPLPLELLQQRVTNTTTASLGFWTCWYSFHYFLFFQESWKGNYGYSRLWLFGRSSSGIQRLWWHKWVLSLLLVLLE